VLGLGVVVLYDIELTGVGTLALTAVLATLGLAAAGTLYGAIAAGLRVRETLLPLLLLPVVAPVLLAATRASEAALGTGVAGIDVGQWLGLLVTFAVLYLGVGVVAFGPLLEET
jgi:heme exporter protein B